LITYETAESRKVIYLPGAKTSESETHPHGAGSYHDPEQHMRLMDRVEVMLRDTDSQD
jgi:hypothetical protein